MDITDYKVVILMTSVTFLTIEGFCWNRHPTETCQGQRECPNTYKCVKKDSYTCCKIKVEKFIPGCKISDQAKNNDTGLLIPTPCRGGGGKKCPDKHICKSPQMNIFSVCCLNETEKLFCKDHMGRYYDPGEKWMAKDGCNKCKCKAGGIVYCTNKTKCEGKCKRTWMNECQSCECGFNCIGPCTGSKGNFSSFSPCDHGCGYNARIQKCNNTGKYGQQCTDVHVETRPCQEVCPIEPGLRLTESTPIIISGTEVHPKYNFRWMVHIYSNKGQCGGSILSSTHILTAAHCVQYSTGRPLNVTIRTGKHNVSKTEPWEQIRYSSNFHIHPQYNRTKGYDNDIAIIVVNPPLELNNITQPILLPEKDDFINKYLCVVLGWGDTKGTPLSQTDLFQMHKRYSDGLQYARVKQDLNCSLAEKYINKVTNNMFCASSRKKKSQNACWGDSGGPFICRLKNQTWVQLGIVSWGPDDACVNSSEVYTKVINYIDWLTEVLVDWGKPSDYTPCGPQCGGHQYRVSTCNKPPSLPHAKCPSFSTSDKYTKMIEGVEYLIEVLNCASCEP